MEDERYLKELKELYELAKKSDNIAMAVDILGRIRQLEEKYL